MHINPKTISNASAGFEHMASWLYNCGVHILVAGQFVEFILLPWKIFWRWSYLPSFKFWDSNPWPHGAKLLLRCSYIGSRPIRGFYLTPVKDFLKMIISSVIQILGFEPMASWRYYCGVLTLGAGQFVVFILLPWKIFWKWSYLPSFKFWDSNPWPHAAITVVFIYWEQANSWSLSYSRKRFSEDDHIFRHSNLYFRSLHHLHNKMMV